MTKDDIIRMAKEASASGNLAGLDAGTPLWLERFAKLVASAECEACAKIVEVEAMQYAEPVWAFEIVNDIRARP